jgi:hypothetical protein
VLLPGDHEIVVRRAGYDDFVKPIVIEPGEARTVRSSCTRRAGCRPATTLPS